VFPKNQFLTSNFTVDREVVTEKRGDVPRPRLGGTRIQPRIGKLAPVFRVLYCSSSAVRGSTWDARHAGATEARSPAAPSTAIVPPSVMKSYEATP
jgi:hypothetical protein